MNDTVKQILQDQKASILEALNSTAKTLTNAQTELGWATNNYNALLQKLNDITSVLGDESVVVDQTTMQASLAPIVKQDQAAVDAQTAP